MKPTIPTLLVFVFVGSCHDARAAVIARIEENGDGVLAFYSGSINLVGLQVYSPNPLPSFGYQNIQADSGRFGIGGSVYFLRYRGLQGPQIIGSGSPQYIPKSVTGDFMGIWGKFGDIWVPVNYSSDSPISGTSLWSGQTLGSMGLSVGEYTWTWGSGASSDSIILQVVPEASPAILVWLGLFSLISRRRRAEPNNKGCSEVGAIAEISSTPFG